MDWDEYLRWLLQNKHHHYGRNMWLLGRRTFHMAFTPELVMLESTRRKEDILKAISNICRFLDIKCDTYYHEEFLRWMKRKEVKWKSQRSTRANYAAAESIPVEGILSNISSLPYEYRLFCGFILVSGLRTEESVRAFNGHSALCNGRVIEMFWERRTKKANAVFCHPSIHKRISFQINHNTLYRKLRSGILGCQIRYLRKLNFTMVATNVDPLLAEFMQGRRGGVSQRHYFLPMMRNNQKRWEKMWDPILRKIKITSA